MGTPHLRVTRRCLVDDLDLPGERFEDDARDFEDLHAAVKKFVAMRGNAPHLGEPTYGPYKRGLICSLHVGSARAVTTWDADEEVCWLLGYNDFHRNGDPDDAFEVFNAHFAAGNLLPTDQDYEDFFKEVEVDFLDRLAETGRLLLEQARAAPGNEAMETWHDGARQVMCVDILIEGDARAEEGWMGLTLPENEPVTDEELYDAVVRLVPPEVTLSYSKKFKDRDARRGEIVFTWEHYDGV